MTTPRPDRNKRLQYFFGSKDREFRRCLAAGMNCRRAPIRAHSIQNAGILDALARGGTLITPQIRFSADTGPEVTFRPEGRNRASTFTGLCAHHDTSTFQDLERKPLQLDDEHQLFLLAYRAVLRGTHGAMRAGAMLQGNFIDGIKHGMFTDSPGDPAGMFALSRLLISWLVFRYLTHFWEIEAAASFGSCRHIVLSFPDCRPSFAVSSLHDWASTGIALSTNADLPCSTLTVLPHDGHMYAVISYLSEHERIVRLHLDPILTATGRKQRVLLSQFVLRRSENLVLAPAFFDTLSADRIRAIETFFHRTILNPDHTESDDRLDLFWA